MKRMAITLFLLMMGLTTWANANSSPYDDRINIRNIKMEVIEGERQNCLQFHYETGGDGIQVHLNVTGELEFFNNKIDKASIEFTRCGLIVSGEGLFLLIQKESEIWGHHFYHNKLPYFIGTVDQEGFLRLNDNVSISRKYIHLYRKGPFTFNANTEHDTITFQITVDD